MKRLLFTVIIFAILFTSLSCDTTSVPTTVKDIKTFQEDVDSDADMELVVKFILTDDRSNVAAASGNVTYIFLRSPQSGGQEEIIFTDERQITDKQSEFTAYFKKSKFAAPCERCKGTGYEACSYCSGTGKISCPTCKGTGITDLDCPACRGTGKVDLQTYKTLIHFTNPTNCPWADYYIRQMIPAGESTLPCPICEGRGKKLCPICNGSGEISCPQCNGTGRVKCTNPDCKNGIVCYSGKSCSLVVKFQRGDGITIEGRNNSVLLP